MYNHDDHYKKMKQERETLSSRYHSLHYSSDDYDRAKGKGAFKKKYPDGAKLLTDLLDKKIALDIKIANYSPKKEEQDLSAQPDSATVPTY